MQRRRWCTSAGTLTRSPRPGTRSRSAESEFLLEFCVRFWCSCCPPLQLLQGLLLCVYVLLFFLFCWLPWGFSQFFRAREMHASVRVVVEAGRRCPLPRSCSIALFSPHRLIDHVCHEASRRHGAGAVQDGRFCRGVCSACVQERAILAHCVRRTNSLCFRVAMLSAIDGAPCGQVTGAAACPSDRAEALAPEGREQLLPQEELREVR